MRIARVYFDCDLRCGFEGLRKVLNQNNVDSRHLGKGDLTVFMNRKGTSFKLLAGDVYLTYFKNGHRKIPLESIKFLPLFFDGTAFDIPKAINKSIREKLGINT